MYLRVSLFLFTWLCFASLCGCEAEDCDYTEHKQPIPILNSKYTVQKNGNICCPLDHADSECISKEVMESCCPHGVKREPCRHCWTCARGPGERCGGPYGGYGECADGLECTADKTQFLWGVNVSGICEGAVYKDEFESCGGDFWEVGRCKEGFECKEVVDEKLCINSSVKLRDNCSKNCSKRPYLPACGSDGRIYNHVCFLRQQNCKHDSTMAITKKDDLKFCRREVCPDITPPLNSRIIRTNGIKAGSEVTIVCKHNHTQFFPATSNKPANMPSLTCDCEGSSCLWMMGSIPWKDDTDLPKCVIVTPSQSCTENATLPPVAVEMEKPTSKQNKGTIANSNIP